MPSRALHDPDDRPTVQYGARMPGCTLHGPGQAPTVQCGARMPDRTLHGPGDRPTVQCRVRPGPKVYGPAAGPQPRRNRAAISASVSAASSAPARVAEMFSRT